MDKLSAILLAVTLFGLGPLTPHVFGAQSKWDEALLNMEFRDVSINARGMLNAWREITKKYLLRANFYTDVELDSDLEAFAFNKDSTTGKEILETLLDAFPAYTYTQDRETGVIWVHPKRIKYEDILSQKIQVTRPLHQVRMYAGIYEPLCDLLSSDVIRASVPKSGSPSSVYCYFVDLPAGVFATREIINYCSVANPTKAFSVGPKSIESSNRVPISIWDLNYCDGMHHLPRIAALKIWEIEIGKPENEIPSVKEINMALCDASATKRWAAVAFLEAAQANYSPIELIKNNSDPEKTVWVALEMENLLYRGMGDHNFFDNVAVHFPGIQNNLMQITHPELALVTSLELAREKKNFANLDEMISKHKYSEGEIARMKPYIYRFVNESPLVLAKLKGMKLDAPEFTAAVLRDLEETNLLIRAP